jgi:tetratricopeptide (TPR) repeat protein
LKWDSEVNDLLWSVARGPTKQQWALKALSRKYTAAHDTRALINVTNRMLELDPQDAAAKNRMASLLFQTNASLERARQLAREAYAKDPKNPRFAATYAYALHLQGKTTEGIEIMRSLPGKLLETSPYSTFNAVLLANGGTPDEAYKFIQLAEKENPLPEETEILGKARMSLRRRGFSE